MEKIILHCDLNNFFASASLTKNPTLTAFPVAVCGDSEKRHGIVLAKNNIAKSFGVETAETVWQAKQKCPELIILKPNFELYEKFSLKAREIYLSYSDKVEPFGIDECWIDISNFGIDFIKGEKIAEDIRKRIKSELGLTVSVGVSFNKVFAKLGSDLKKPDAVTVIRPDNFKKKIWPLYCGELLMVGSSTQQKLRAMGIFTIGDIANADSKILESRFGKNGISMQKAANGKDNSPVVSAYKNLKPKSLSNSATVEYDLTEKEQVFRAFLEFSESISEKLKTEGLLASKVGIQTTTFDFEVNRFQHSLEVPTDLAYVIAESAMKIFENNCNFEKPFRAIGVRVFQLSDKNITAKQLSLFEKAENEKMDIIENKISEIRNKYGKDSIKRACSVNNSTFFSTPGFYKR